jgi:biotin transport system substrate-specific component
MRKLIRLCLVALFAALTAAGTFVAIPLPVSPVPIVLQNMFALLSGMVLGPAWGSLSVALYLAAGTLGAPVFVGGSGGIAHFLSPSGGYLPGYFLAALVSGRILGRPRPGMQTPVVKLIIAAALGMLVVYLPGLARLKVVLSAPWPAVFASGFLPFIIGDVIKGAAAVLIAPRLRRAAAHLE